MALRTSGDFLFGPAKFKVIPLNYDKSTALPLTGASGSPADARGGVGPFDYSGVALATAVEFKVKIDTVENSVVSIDISGASDQSAVTVAELVTAITAAGYTNITAQAHSDGYIELEVTTPTGKNYLQVYGEGARIAEFGQGADYQFILCDTQQSIAKSPTLKDAETITVTDSNGLDTELIADSYRKGLTAQLVDTAIDYALKQILEGGTYDSTNTFYSHPTSEDVKKYFAVEIMRKYYSKGTNKAEDYVGVILERIYTAVADVGDDAGDRNWAVQNYNIIATSYKDPETSTIYADLSEKKFTKGAWDTFDWESI